ncbi:signal peptidase II [Polyangium fumosum]|uniref:Lipoprotein signal peptidase n=1 Tax=Polyangium fumosum TaxID=889272 RepID=A0A4U1JD91_9BACT|nr:signal peptidase II [Polyangium fumosum]TKD08664.1 signal peptidase II [Polyangium fumosum]
MTGQDAEEKRAEAPPDDAYRPSMLFLAVITVVSAAADLASKGWAKAALSGADKGRPKSIEVIKDHFDFIYTLNPGGAWSFLRSLPENLRRPFFLFVSSAAIVFIVSVYRRIHRDQWAMRWGLPLALGGAVGNLVDRIRYGSVIDFIDFYVIRNGREIHWPTFNVADIAIVAGVLLMALDTFLSRKTRGGLGEPVPPAEPLTASPAPPSPLPPPGEA